MDYPGPPMMVYTINTGVVDPQQAQLPEGGPYIMLRLYGSTAR
jgi:hypothetical protein